MSLKKEDMRPGLVIVVPDVVSIGEEREATVVGLNPYTGEWVAACPQWVMGISELDDDDYAAMELKK